MLTFRTKPPLSYQTPSRQEMKEVAEKVGLKGFSPSLVADLCHMAKGGEVVAPSKYRQIVQQQVEKKVDAKASNFSTQVEERLVKAMRYHSRVVDFVRSIDLERFPGSSPLEKAISLFKLLSKQQGGSVPAGGDAESLPIFFDKDPAEVQDALESIIDDVESLTDAELDLIDPKGEGHELDEEKDGQRSGSGDLKALKIAEKLLPGTDERKILDIARKLNTFTQMEVKKQKRVIPDPESEDIRHRPIRNLSELGKLTTSGWAKKVYLPRGYFNYLAICGGLVIRERIREEEKKQAILILLDSSGSMNGEKHLKASGIVMNRLFAVVEGDAEVYLCTYDTTLTVLGEAKDPAEARELIQKFRKGNFKGGGTNTAVAVKEGHKLIEEKIKNGEALWRPEIVILTDEDSSVEGVTAQDIPGTRVHGFAMGVKNPSLVAFAQSTGGIGVDRF